MPPLRGKGRFSKDKKPKRNQQSLLFRRKRFCRFTVTGVESIDYKDGDFVKEGTPLFAIEPETYKLKLEQAKAAEAGAQASLKQAEADYKRQADLVARQAMSQATLDTSTSNRDNAQANLQQAQANTRIAEVNFGYTKVTAPFDGIVSAHLVSVGELVGASSPTQLATIVALDPIYVNFSVPQQSIGQVRVGRSIRITANDAAGGEWTGRVSAIDSKVDEATRNIQIQATIANPDGKLRPGMFVEAEVGLGPSQALVALPASAVSYAPFGDSVFVVAELKAPDGSTYRGVRQQFVKLGPARGDQISIVSGVKAGDEVVTSGVFKLRNGAAVLINNQVKPGNNPSPKPENS